MQPCTCPDASAFELAMKEHIQSKKVCPPRAHVCTRVHVRAVQCVPGHCARGHHSQSKKVSTPSTTSTSMAYMHKHSLCNCDSRV